MNKLTKKEALDILIELKNLEAEIYGVSCFIKKNDEFTPLKERSYIKEKHDAIFYNSKGNYIAIKEFIEEGSDDHYFLFFYDYPNENIKFRLIGVTKIYDNDNAKKMLDLLQDKNSQLLEIDGFFITGKTTQPSQDYSIGIDFSQHPYKDWNYTDPETYKFANELIQNSPADFYFEFIYKY